MSLKLYSHPLASYCHKVLIALYENQTPFQAMHVDLGDVQSRDAFLAVWPMGKMPVLVDERAGRMVPESSVIIEYLGHRYPGAAPLLPDDRDALLEVRLWDRLFDSYVMSPMQAIVAQHLRPEAQRDAHVTSSSRETLDVAYELIERQLADKQWAAGDTFTMADCAAAPALFYASIVHPFPAGCRRLADYYERLMTRPSVARVLKEARPYFEMFPLKSDIPARFLHD